MRIGVFGGTFNPPHMGHLIVAESVRHQLSLDRVIFVPSYIPPHKQDRQIASGQERLEMVRLAVKGNQALEVSDLEIRRGGVSYTVDTLAHMKQEHEGSELFMLIGMDNLLEFQTWREPGRIRELARLVVMTRPGFAREDLHLKEYPDAEWCVVPEIEISSTEIRAKVKEGKSIRYLVAPAVEQFVIRTGLYVE